MMTLAARMRERAKTDTANATVLNAHALALESTTAAYVLNGDVVAMKRFLGAWARARRYWCDLTGEPLI